MKRVIFDLDGTLLTGSFDFEKEYFTDLYGEKAKKLIDNMGLYLDEYEKTFSKYKHDDLSRFLSLKSGFSITNKVIDGWIEVMREVPDTMEEGVVETLEYLKNNGCSNAILTNWYGMTQIPRLKKTGILHYFDDVYTGDFVLKPHKEAYMLAKGEFSIDDCTFIGDNLDKDYIGPRIYGFDSIMYDKDDKYHKSLKKVKRINDIIER